MISLPPDPTAYSRALATLWNEIAPVGRDPLTGGYRRFAWTDEDRTLREWFAGAAQARGLEVTLDRAGNQWAWSGDPDQAARAGRPGLVLGSHLDSVPDGGPYDGPLGVVSALAAIEVLRAEGFEPDRPVGVVCFGDEEGARYGVACAGSRLMTGALDADRARALRDADGRTMASGMAAAGLDADQVGPDPVALQRIGTFVELHVEQGRGLVDLGAPVGVASAIWPHGRWRFDFDGEANHAGTTRLADRRDPMLSYAEAVLAARRAAEDRDALATFAKVRVEPNGVNAIPSRVTAWLDSRAATSEQVRAVVHDLAGVGASVTEESWTDETGFDSGLQTRLAGLLADGDGRPAPVLATGAGHDAGILSLAGVATAMLFVRNPTGVSHSPDEFAEEADCVTGVEALARVVRGAHVMTAYWCEQAWVDNAAVASVRVVVGDDGRIAAVETGAGAQDEDTRLAGLVLPGFANAHSHAFHRALRGRTHADGGTFWTWRESMYAVAAQLDPDSYLALARATYAEMALAGVTCVGEFHYLHHGADGTPYDDPNAMGHALIQAAGDAGIRLTLLDACYLKGGLTPDGHTLLDIRQRRFSDWNVEQWAARVSRLEQSDAVRIGVAAHSVRAVEKIDIGRIAAMGGPMHIHVSEQPAENDACRAFYLSSPTELLEDEGALGDRITAVHCTHLSERDQKLLGASRTNVCFTPTTERDLADGIGPAPQLRDAGAVLTLGSDQHAVIDLFEEARGLELDDRLVSLQRGRFRPDELVRAMTVDGHRSLGWDDAGRIAVGARADLVAVRLDSVRTAGSAPDQVVMSATAFDVRDVIVDGRAVVTDGQHRLGDVGRMLSEAIDPLWATS